MNYLGSNDIIFTIKLGFISAPPSLTYFLNNFSHVVFGYESNIGYQGLFNRTYDLLFLLQLISVVLVLSLLKSLYFSWLNQINEEGPLDFKKLVATANKHWYKYLILTALGMFILLSSIGMLFLYSIVTIMFLYVEYCIVVDDKPLMDALGHSASVFYSNFLNTILLGISLGLLMSLSSFFIFSFVRSGVLGQVLAIIIVAFMGVISNKVVMEAYREFSAKKMEA